MKQSHTVIFFTMPWHLCCWIGVLVAAMAEAAPFHTAVTKNAATSSSRPSSFRSLQQQNDREDSRMVAYLGNWHACPTAAQLDQYTHVMIAFAVSYTWAPGKNNCSPTCEIATPPICANAPNTALIDDLHTAGKKVMLSFGGAGMGGSWAGSSNDCWEYCYGREEQVVDRLVEIVAELNLDGVDIDYEYYYTDNQNGSGFAKGAEAISFLRQVTLGLRDKLPADASLAHVPMDPDVVAGTDYFDMLVEVRDALDFVMPQFYNGLTQPATDGFDGTGSGSVAAAAIYDGLVESLFDGDATKVVFGFCISECGVFNVNPSQATTILAAVEDDYDCHGGAFFWVANDDRTASWSTSVNQAMSDQRGCAATSSNSTWVWDDDEEEDSESPIIPLLDIFNC